MALMVEFDGVAFSGMQFQPNASSVQETLEWAIWSLTHDHVRIRAASRTDAGVHAVGQVVAFETTSTLPLERFRPGLNHYLPALVSVTAAHEVPQGFDPRRRALSRTYRYTFLVRPTRSPLRGGQVYQVQGPLFLAAMREALAYLEGERDFAPFAGYVPLGKSTVRVLFRTAAWQRYDEVYLELEGSAFLPQQVRRIAGEVLAVGQSRRSLQSFKELADSGVRGAAVRALPSRGLCLREVLYKDFPPRDDERKSDNHIRVAERTAADLAGC